MVDLLDGYVGSSCVIKAKNNDLISMGVLHRIGKNFIDVSSSRNELPGNSVQFACLSWRYTTHSLDLRCSWAGYTCPLPSWSGSWN